MAIVRDWLTTIPAFGSFSPGRVILAAAGASAASGKSATRKGRLTTATYSRREAGKTDKLLRLSSSKRRTSTSAVRSTAKGRPHRMSLQPQEADSPSLSPASPTRQSRDAGNKDLSLSRLSLPNLSTEPSWILSTPRREFQQQPQQQQQQCQVYSQQTPRVSLNALSSPRWAQTARVKKQDQILQQEDLQQRQRSRSMETLSAAARPPHAARAESSAWGSASNLLGAQSSGGAASPDASAHRPRTSAILNRNANDQPHRRYERVANPKPLHESRDTDASPTGGGGGGGGFGGGGGWSTPASRGGQSKFRSRWQQRQHQQAAQSTTSEVKKVAEHQGVDQSAKRAVEGRMSQAVSEEVALASSADAVEDRQSTSTIDFRLLREIGQRRPQPALSVEESEALFNPAPPPSSPERIISAAAQRQHQSQAAQTQPTPQPIATYYAKLSGVVGVGSAHASASPSSEYTNLQGEPQTAVGYFTERERLHSASQAEHNRLQQHPSSTETAPNRSEFSTSQRQQQNQQQQLAASRTTSQSVFQLQAEPVAGLLVGGQNPNLPRSTAAVSAKSAVRPIERKPVNYGYNWLQEFNKMSMTEAEIEKRVKNGGKLRNSASQTTRFELPFDLRDLEEMDPKDYLRQYTVVSSRRIYLYQKVFQKYKNPSLNAVEVKDLPKCISDIIVGGISEEKLEEVMELTGLKDAGQLDSKLFQAFCAVVERQTTGKIQPDDPSEVMESHKQKLECADFIGLNFKFRGVNLSEKMSRLLRAL